MDPNHKNRLIGLKFAKWGGYLLQILLLLLILGLVFGETQEPLLFKWIKGLYFAALVAILLLPFDRLKNKTFKLFFPLLCLLSVGFVFLMVVEVMFAYMAAAEIGERLGVPGFEGMLIFLTLLQIPTILFRRNPDLLD